MFPMDGMSPPSVAPTKPDKTIDSFKKGLAVGSPTRTISFKVETVTTSKPPTNASIVFQLRKHIIYCHASPFEP